MELNGQYTRDRDKKRKKWIDCILSVEDDKRVVVTDIDGGKFVCKVSVDASQLQMLRDGEDVTLGFIILRSDGLMEKAPTHIQPRTDLAPYALLETDLTRQRNLSANISHVTTAPPQPLSHSQLNSMHVSSSSNHQITEVNESSIDGIPDTFAPVVLASNKLTRMFKAPSSTASSRYGSKSSSATTAMSLSSTQYDFTDYFYMFSGQQGSKKKKVGIINSFDSPTEYADHFYAALSEDLYLTMYNAITQIERYYLKAKTMPMASICRQFGHLYMSNGELIISNDSENIPNKKTSWSSIPSKFSKKSSSDEDEEGAMCDDTPISVYNVNTKIYIKMSRVDVESMAKCGESSPSKGDLWLLWLASPSNATSSLPSHLQNKYAAMRSNGYILPCLEGNMYEPVWVCRSQWHGLSSEGMLLITDINGKSYIPSFFGSLASGRTKGVLKRHISGMRLCSEGVNITALDLLYGGTTAAAATAIQPAANNPFSFNFSCLLESNAFMNSLQRFRPTQCPQKLLQSFPQLDDSIVNKMVNLVSLSFRLNNDQTEVLKRVGSWFTTSSNADDDIIIVHGVFGSGKSHLLCSCIHLINQLSNSLIRCLVSSQTNVAVDRILLQLLKLNVSPDLSQDSAIPFVSNNVIRVGCASKVDKNLRSVLVLQADSIIAATIDLQKIIKREGKDIALQKLLAETEKNDFSVNQRKRLLEANVIGTTCASAVSPLLRNMSFGVLFIDEASQIVEPVSLLPLVCSQAVKLIIVGDPMQLPPIVAENTNGVFSALKNTLFDRLLQCDRKLTMLRTQYRCHPLISNICSELFYDNKIVNGLTAQDRQSLLPGLPSICHILNSQREEKSGGSYINTEEANKIRDIVCLLLDYDSSFSIGVICFYKPQACLISSLLASILPTIMTEGGVQVKVSTIDSFQGQENDFILLATTRSSESAFLCDKNRLNVAISRSKFHLILFGQLSLFAKSYIWKSILDKSIIIPSLNYLQSFASNKAQYRIDPKIPERLKCTSNKLDLDCPTPQIELSSSIPVPYERKTVADIETSLRRLRQLKQAKAGTLSGHRKRPID